MAATSPPSSLGRSSFGRSSFTRASFSRAAEASVAPPVQLAPPTPPPPGAGPPPPPRSVGIVGASSAAAADALTDATSTHAILIPGTGRAVTGRRFAVSAGGLLSAYVVGASVRVAVKGGGGGGGSRTPADGGGGGGSRAPADGGGGASSSAAPVAPRSLALRGHNAPVVDVEFLPSGPNDPLHVLGTADTESVVCLWMLTTRGGVADADADGGGDGGVSGGGGSGAAPPSPLRLVRRYRFYTLRRSTDVHYSRLRLGGTAAAATMVLVPNDGSAPRLIKWAAVPVFDAPGSGRVVGAAVAEGGGGGAGADRAS